MIVFTFVQTPIVALAGSATIIAGLSLYFVARPKQKVPTKEEKP